MLIIPKWYFLILLLLGVWILWILIGWWLIIILVSIFVIAPILGTFVTGPIIRRIFKLQNDNNETTKFGLFLIKTYVFIIAPFKLLERFWEKIERRQLRTYYRLFPNQKTVLNELEAETYWKLVLSEGIYLYLLNSGNIKFENFKFSKNNEIDWDFVDEWLEERKFSKEKAEKYRKTQIEKFISEDPLYLERTKKILRLLKSSSLDESKIPHEIYKKVRDEVFKHLKEIDY